MGVRTAGGDLVLQCASFPRVLDLASVPSVPARTTLVVVVFRARLSLLCLVRVAPTASSIILSTGNKREGEERTPWVAGPAVNSAGYDGHGHELLIRRNCEADDLLDRSIRCPIFWAQKCRWRPPSETRSV